MSKAKELLEKLKFDGFDDKDLVSEYKGCNIYKWDNPRRGEVYVAVTKKDGLPAYVDNLGFKIKTKGVIHSSDWDGVLFRSESDAKKAIDKMVSKDLP